MLLEINLSIVKRWQMFDVLSDEVGDFETWVYQKMVIQYNFTREAGVLHCLCIFTRPNEGTNVANATSFSHSLERMADSNHVRGLEWMTVDSHELYFWENCMVGRNSNWSPTYVMIAFEMAKSSALESYDRKKYPWSSTRTKEGVRYDVSVLFDVSCFVE